MTEERNDEIKEAAKEYASTQLGNEHDEYFSVDINMLEAFKAGAKWADEHPDAIDMNYLSCWYQDSVDETQEPIWTDKHIEELFNDFYLIPKDIEE